MNTTNIEQNAPNDDRKIPQKNHSFVEENLGGRRKNQGIDENKSHGITVENFHSTPQEPSQIIWIEDESHKLRAIGVQIEELLRKMQERIQGNGNVSNFELIVEANHQKAKRILNASNKVLVVVLDLAVPYSQNGEIASLELLNSWKKDSPVVYGVALFKYLLQIKKDDPNRRNLKIIIFSAHNGEFEELKEMYHETFNETQMWDDLKIIDKGNANCQDDLLNYIQQSITSE